MKKNIIYKNWIIIYFFTLSFLSGQNFDGVFVGINEYYDNGVQIPESFVYGPKEAIEMRDHLINYQGWNGSTLRTLTNTAATFQEITNAVRNLTKNSSTNCMFYFSGGGVSTYLPNPDINNGIVTVNMNIISPQTLQDCFAYGNSSYNNYTCLIDAPGSGVFTLYMNKGVIGTACGANQYAYQSSVFGNSVWTHFLLKGLENDTADPDGGVSAEELIAYAYHRTADYVYDPPIYQEPRIGDYYNGDLKLESETDHDITWLGRIDLTSNFTIPSGYTLNIMPSTRIYISPGVKIEVYGILNADGEDRYNPISFQNTNGNGHWEAIDFKSGSSGYFKNCSIINAQYGIKAYNSNIVIENSELMNNSIVGIYLSAINNTSIIKNCKVYGIGADYQNYGIFLFNSDPLIKGCLITGHRYDGCIFHSHSEPTLYYNTIQNNTNNGVSVYSGSNPSFGEPASGAFETNHGYNRIVSNGNHGMYFNNASGFMGFTAAILMGGRNSLFGNSQKQLYAENNSNVEAGNNYWATSNPPNVIYKSSNSYVVWQVPLSSDPGGGSSLSKQSSTGEAPAEKQFDPNNVNKNDVKEMYQLAMYKKYTGKEDEAIQVFEDILNRFPKSNYVFKVMGELFNISKTSKKVDIDIYCDNNINRKGVSKKIKLASKEIKALKFMRENKKEAAIRIFRDILKMQPEKESEKKSLFNLFLLGMDEDVKNVDEQEYLAILKKKYPNEEETYQAMLLNGEKFEREDKETPQLRKELTEDTTPTEYNLSAAYPNPFNPSTTISYSLPFSSDVNIGIYDIMGREVKSYEMNNLSIGTYSTVWNGKNNYGEDVSSGVYILRLKANSLEGNFKSYEKSLKLLLTK